MEKILKEKLDTYGLHRQLNLDILESLESRDLGLRPIAAAGIFGKQFRHLLDIEKCYIEAILEGRLDFLRSDIDHSLETDRETLASRLRDADAMLYEAMEIMPGERCFEKYIDCSAVSQYLAQDVDGDTPLHMIEMLTEHEVFHGGQLALYLREISKPFPARWMAWGLK